jgi:hypothetical protein
MSAEAPEARLGSVQTTEVVVVQDQPTGAETETKVVLVGIGSVKVTPEAAAGPLLVMVCVYVMSLPDQTVAGVATVLNAKSACEEEDATTSVAVEELPPKA